MRQFSLNDPEAYEALRSPPDPWGWGPRLSRNSRWRERSDPVAVMAGIEPRSSVRGTERDVQVEAEDAFAEWQRHVDAGRIGPEHRG
jgi:hypothetical protein